MRAVGALIPIRVPSIGILVPNAAPAIGVTTLAIDIFVSGCGSVRFGFVGFFAFKNIPTTTPTTRSAISMPAVSPPCIAGLFIGFVIGALLELSSPKIIVALLDADALGEIEGLGLLNGVSDVECVEERLGVSVLV